MRQLDDNIGNTLVSVCGNSAFTRTDSALRICISEINTVSGRLVLNARFGTHPLQLCGVLRQNQCFPAKEDSLQH